MAIPVDIPEFNGAVSSDMADPANWVGGILPERNGPVVIRGGNVPFAVWPESWDWDRIPILTVFGRIGLDIESSPDLVIDTVNGVDGYFCLRAGDPPPLIEPSSA